MVRGLVVLVLCGGYKPSGVEPCTVSCDLAKQDCPGDLECRADGLCHTPGSELCGSSDASPLDGVPNMPNFVFVTSLTKAPQDLGGLDAADRLCNQRAAAGGLPGTYVAWLS